MSDETDGMSERTIALLRECDRRWSGLVTAAKGSRVTAGRLGHSLPDGSEPHFSPLYKALSRYEQAVGAAVASIRQDYADAKRKP